MIVSDLPFPVGQMPPPPNQCDFADGKTYRTQLEKWHANYYCPGLIRNVEMLHDWLASGYAPGTSGIKLNKDQDMLPGAAVFKERPGQEQDLIIRKLTDAEDAILSQLDQTAKPLTWGAPPKADDDG